VATPHSIVVVDDHLSYAEALAMALRTRQPDEEVLCAQTADELLDVVDQAWMVVLDWQIGGTDGIDTARALRDRSQHPHVVMISGHHSAALERLASSAGVCAVLPKRASIDSIVTAIERCRHDPGHQREMMPHEHDDTLSRRQVEVLWLLSTGYDVRDVANRLFLSVATVRTYVRDACKRLDAHSQLEAVAKARRAGLIPTESSPPATTPRH
jgi:DNA-binding NarL/FixJ family response regulator